MAKKKEFPTFEIICKAVGCKFNDDNLASGCSVPEGKAIVIDPLGACETYKARPEKKSKKKGVK